MSSFSIDCLDKNKTVMGKQNISISKDAIDDNCISFLSKSGKTLFTVDSLKKELVFDNSANDFGNITSEEVARLKIDKIQMDYQDNLIFTIEGKKDVFRISGNALEQKVGGKFQPIMVANEPFDIVLPRTLFNDIEQGRLTVDAMPFQMFEGLDQATQNSMQVSTFKSSNNILHIVKANNQLYVARGGKLIPVDPQNANYYKMGDKSLIGFTLGTRKSIAGKNRSGIGFVVPETEVDAVAQFVNGGLEGVTIKNADDYKSNDIGYTMVRKPTDATKKYVEDVADKKTTSGPKVINVEYEDVTNKDISPKDVVQLDNNTITGIVPNQIEGTVEKLLPDGGEITIDNNNTDAPVDNDGVDAPVNDAPTEAPIDNNNDNTSNSASAPSEDKVPSSDATSTSSKDAPAPHAKSGKTPPDEKPKDKKPEMSKMNLTSDGIATIALFLGALLISGVWTSIFAFALFGLLAFMALGTSTLATYESVKNDKGLKNKKEKLSKRQKINARMAKLYKELDKLKAENKPENNRKIKQIENEIARLRNKIDALNKKEEKRHLSSREHSSNDRVGDEMVLSSTPEAPKEIKSNKKAPVVSKKKSTKTSVVSSSDKAQSTTLTPATSEEISSTAESVHSYLASVEAGGKKSKDEILTAAGNVNNMLLSICPDGIDVSDFPEAERPIMQEIINFRNTYTIAKYRQKISETDTSPEAQAEEKTALEDLSLQMYYLYEAVGQRNRTKSDSQAEAETGLVRYIPNNQ